MYSPEIFTDEERTVLSRFFTNTDGPVFALINLPEVVKGALFARYSRSPKSLRRLFLDEFYEQPEFAKEDLVEDSDKRSPVSLERAENLILVNQASLSPSNYPGLLLSSLYLANVRLNYCFLICLVDSNI